MQIDNKGQAVKPLLIHSGRNEFQVYLMLLLILVGGLFLVNGTTNDPQLGQVPGWIQIFWGTGLVVSGFVNLFANFYRWHDIKNGLQLEMMSCIAIIITVLIYTISLIAFLEDRNIDRFLSLDLLAIITFVRLFRLQGFIRDINRLRRLDVRARAAADQFNNGHNEE